MAPVIKSLERHPDRLVSRVVITAQHREMTDQVLRLFDITPHHDLNIMVDNQSPTAVASTILARLEPILKTERPDWVLVQGDTTTAMATALAAFYARIKLGHVEAGLRTYDRWQPFPEEINRCIISLMADWNFAPTVSARLNLIKSGVPADTICVTGNPVIDALRQVAQIPPEQGPLHSLLPRGTLPRLILVTAHRRESFGQGLRNICQAIREICARYQDNIRFIYPVHPNPNVQQPVWELLGEIPQVKLLPPLTYQELVQVMLRSYLVLTDSGGIQEEAPSLKKPVLVLRETTERPEAVVAGTVQLVGTKPDRIVEAFVRLWEDSVVYYQMSRAINPYGDGKAAERITKALLGEVVSEFAAASAPVARTTS